MQLPIELRLAIEREASVFSPAALAASAAALSSAYRQGKGRPNMSGAESVAYALVRMPATYACIRSVLSDLAPCESVLDLGAGPGTTGWAAAASWEGLRTITLVEREHALSALGRRLAAESETEALRHARWISEDITAVSSFEPHDAVVLSYALGEFASDVRLRIVETAWQAARKALILIEPGTTPGFSLIRDMRSHLVAGGARIVAPCPHNNPCPIPEGDWCHFAARVERTALHRKLKGGEMSYEDEKFSYVAVYRDAAEPARARIIRRPVKEPGLIQLVLCGQEGIAQARIRKRDSLRWPAARKSVWGDPWDF